MKKLFFSLLFIVVAGYFIVKSINLQELRGLLIHFPREKLGILLAISVLMALLRSWRFFLYVRDRDVKISFWEACKVFIAGQAMSPLPGGEAGRAVLLKEETNATYKQAAGPIFVQGFTELLVAALLAVLGSFYVHLYVGPAIGMLVVIIIIGYALVHPVLIDLTLGKLGSRWAYFQKFEKKASEVQEEMKRSIFKGDSYHLNAIFITGLVIALATNLLGGVLLLLISNFYHQKIGIILSLFIYTSSVVVALLDNISPIGIGFTEGGMAGLYSLSSVDLSTALAIVVTYRFVTLIFGVVIGFLFLVLFYSKSFFQKIKKS